MTFLALVNTNFFLNSELPGFDYQYYVLDNNKTYPMDSGPWDTISFAFQGGIIAFLDINKATSLGVNSHN